LRQSLETKTVRGKVLILHGLVESHPSLPDRSRLARNYKRIGRASLLYFVSISIIRRVVKCSFAENVTSALESAALRIGIPSTSDVGCPTATLRLSLRAGFLEKREKWRTPGLFGVNVWKQQRYTCRVEVAHPPRSGAPALILCQRLGTAALYLPR
jgi:hypothetical protein